MKKIKIQGWHGQLSPELSAKLNGMASVLTPAFQWEYTGTLQEFADGWGQKFLAMPSHGPSWSWEVYVTQYPGWGMR